MDDQIRVSASDGVEDLQKQPDALIAREVMRLDVLIDRSAIDVLEYEIRLTARAHAGVEQSRDSRMCELRENRPLAAKACLPRGRHEREIEELHRRASFEAAIGSAREPYGAHAAVAERTFERIGAELEALERYLRRRFEE